MARVPVGHYRWRFHYSIRTGRFILPHSRYHVCAALRCSRLSGVDSPCCCLHPKRSRLLLPAPVADGQDGIYLASDSSRPGRNASFTDVFCTKYGGDRSCRHNGNAQAWTTIRHQKFTAGKKLVWLNDANGLMVPIQGTDGAQGQSGLLVQRVDTAGVRRLGDRAVPVILIAPNGPVPADISATVDGAVVRETRARSGQGTHRLQPRGFQRFTC